MPTRFGLFRAHVFTELSNGKEHVAMVHGTIFDGEFVPTRIHSECLTGDVMASLRCDCREQLEKGLAELAQRPGGVLLYLRQEGRGIGLANKIRAYRLQEDGLDTVDANVALGFRDDERDYGVAAAMLRQLGVRSVELMTNNPDKLAQLARYGIPARRVRHAVPPNAHNARYLATKASRSGHLLDGAE